MPTRDPLIETVCVVVPMFNEATTIAEVVRSLLNTFTRVVCVDDGSTDESAEIASFAGADVVRHVVNLGQGAALQTGIDHALKDPTCAHVITFDADGQHRAQDALAMWRVALERDVEVVLGTRFGADDPGMPTSRRLMLRAATLFTRVTTGLAVTDAHIGLRVLSRAATKKLEIKLSGMAHASELLADIARGQLTYCEVPVRVTYTPYSLAKGQRNVNAINIAVDLMVARLYALP
jgi:glycosyltransferase involved in cell wall biosynthesis